MHKDIDFEVSLNSQPFHEIAWNLHKIEIRLTVIV